MTLSAADYRSALDFVALLVAVADRASYRACFARHVGRMVPCDVASMTVMCTAPPATVIAMTDWPPGTGDVNRDRPMLARHWGTHPIVRFAKHHDFDWAPRRISDLVSDRQFAATPIYREFYAPRHLQRELGATFAIAGDEIVVVALDRQQRDFSERDRALLELVGPCVRAAYRAATPDDDSGSARSWQPPSRADRALTPRESQVLRCVAEGASNRAVAGQLGVSPRTVQKHLEHVYRKLGVGTRTAAAVVQTTR